MQKRVKWIGMGCGQRWVLFGISTKKKHQNMESLANAFGDNHQFKLIVQHTRDLSDMVHVEAAKDK